MIQTTVRTSSDMCAASAASVSTALAACASTPTHTRVQNVSSPYFVPLLLSTHRAPVVPLSIYFYGTSGWDFQFLLLAGSCGVWDSHDEEERSKDCGLSAESLFIFVP